MSFRFYTNIISQVSRRLAAGIFLLGLGLIGFGFLIYLLRDLFAMLFAILFCIAGIGCGGIAIKILWSSWKMGGAGRDNSQGYRKNVRIHTEEHYEL